MERETSLLTLVIIVSQKLETRPGSNSGSCHGDGVDGCDHVSQLKKMFFLGLMVTQNGSQWKMILFAICTCCYDNNAVMSEPGKKDLFIRGTPLQQHVSRDLSSQFGVTALESQHSDARNRLCR